MLTLAVILEALSGIQPEQVLADLTPTNPLWESLHSLLNRQITGGVVDFAVCLCRGNVHRSAR